MSELSNSHSYIVSAAYSGLRNDQRRLAVATAFRKYFRTSHYLNALDKSSNWAIFLRPTPEMRDSFGLEREVLCLVTDYAELEVRTLNSAVSLIEAHGARLEQDVFFLVTAASNAETLSEKYSEEHGTRIVVVPWANLQSAHEDYPHEVLRAFFYHRDLFNQTTAVSHDGQFFARYKVVDEIIDNLRNGQNCGVFGLRKIGKTSVLHRVQFQNRLGRHFIVGYIDAQLPEINTTDAATVAFEIIRSLNSAWANAHGGKPFKSNLQRQNSVADASRQLREFVTSIIAHSNQRVLLIIDELERILPSTVAQTPWRTEYLHLWRLLRSVHQECNGRFVFLAASTNPYFSEVSTFEGEDNPLYRFFKPYYLSFFSRDELAHMLSRLGRPMGISFSEDAFDAVYDEFGGHPFLSRQMCSVMAQIAEQRPVSFSAKNVNTAKPKAAGQIRQDIDGILKVFSNYYPAEYSLLTEFAADRRSGRRSLEKNPLSADHLIGYGLLQRRDGDVLDFTMGALVEYFEVGEPTVLKSPDVPAESARRHQTLQADVNQIEPALRALVMTKFREEYSGDWQSEILRHVGETDRQRIDARGSLTAMAFMEELFFPQLLEIISGRFSLFNKTFKSRPTFRGHVKGAEIARLLSDHRKITDCGNNALYMPALMATEFFVGILALR